LFVSVRQPALFLYSSFSFLISTTPILKQAAALGFWVSATALSRAVSCLADGKPLCWIIRRWACSCIGLATYFRGGWLAMVPGRRHRRLWDGFLSPFTLGRPLGHGLGRAVLAYSLDVPLRCAIGKQQGRRVRICSWKELRYRVCCCQIGDMCTAHRTGTISSSG
jgi:hypothetical protein